MGLVREAIEYGLSPTTNANRPECMNATHRVPVGRAVSRLPRSGGFSPSGRPFPWIGELYAESADGKTDWRLYFIESRATATGITDLIVSGAVAPKSVGAQYDSKRQTLAIKSAGHRATIWCEANGRHWRRAT